MRKEIKEARTFTDSEYAIIVLQCLKRAARRPSSWLHEMILPQSLENDAADASEVAKALEYALECVRSREEER